MISTNISPSRHEWNERRVVELQDEIKDQKDNVKKADGFLNKWKEKRILTKMIRQQNKHGQEVLEYEIQKSEQC